MAGTKPTKDNFLELSVYVFLELYSFVSATGFPAFLPGRKKNNWQANGKFQFSYVKEKGKNMHFSPLFYGFIYLLFVLY